MTQISKVDIINALTGWFVPCDEDGTYYLHFTEDSTITAYDTEAVYTYTAKRDISAYNYNEDEYTIYTSASMEDKTFASMVNDMIEAVKAGGVFEVIEKYQIKRSAIIDAIQENVCIESDPFNKGVVEYYLHVSEKGTPLYDRDIDKTEHTYIAQRNVSAYTGEDAIDQIYESETMENERFREMIYDMVEAIRGEGVFEVVED